MMQGIANKNYSRTLLLIILLIFLLLVLPVVIFTWFFHGYSIGKPIDFANFAIYYSGVLTPILTTGSVIALVITLNYQRKQFSEQHKAHRLELLLARFDSAHKAFEKITNGPFNHSSEPEAISLNSVFFIKGNVSAESSSLGEALRIFDILKVVNYEVRSPYELDPEYVEYGKYFLFITQVRVKGLSLIHLYRSFAQFTTSNDRFLLNYLQPIVADIVYQLANWQMISKEDEVRYLSDIDTIDKSKKA